jgi:SAM-dependent methyltransferase
MRRFYELLRCPRCRSPVEGPIPRSLTSAGTSTSDCQVLRCRCSQFPVIAGIPILKNGPFGPAGETTEDLAALIERGRHREALAVALAPDPFTGAPAWLHRLLAARGIWRVRDWIQRQAARRLASTLFSHQPEVTVAHLLRRYYGRWGMSAETCNYFFYRFGQPRHLVALSCATLVEPPVTAVLEVGSGCGHITRHLLHRAAGQVVVGLDRHFFSLYLAKHWIAPEAFFICGDAEGRLPFADGLFSTTLCADAFHYFRDKPAVLAELKRVLIENGLILLVSVRNALVERHGEAEPLRAYRALLGDFPHRMVSDQMVLDRYLSGAGPPLGHAPDLESLEQAPLVTLVATARQEIFRDHQPFDEWPHARGRLGLNPSYRPSAPTSSREVNLRLEFPSAFYEQENTECKLYLPESVTVSLQLWEDLAQGRRTPEVQDLIAHCVLLELPPRYGHMIR